MKKSLTLDLINEPRNILKIWCVFVEKSREMGTFFVKTWVPIFGRITLNMSMGPELQAAHRQPIQI